MDLTIPIDAYCERIGTGFWAEPLNASSNIAFLAAAALGLWYWRRAPTRDQPSLFLIGLVAIVGTGSFLFHTFANRWSILADVIPIAIFIYAYFGLALRRFVGISRRAAFAGTLGFLAVSLTAEPLLAPRLGSSAGYVPALFALYAIGAYLVARAHPQGWLVFAAGAVFTVSLALRMADLPLCPQWPRGTHVFWHILNAATLGLLLVAAVRGAPPEPR
ncbi:MAG TPA: ceramidase domain-containing protein [Aurantimonas sp.]|uniref:Ceramidase domain-containing protein n=1 Tax=Aurantimonas marianensis TaxID=2920428 RepID=A0A9X2H503_9HYPH|nr:ceramidase domain-containing protein [Aurantimonas marianensis]MCP3053870.1 ceramidase domain-containing protein [Aurantimonas marianensis]